MQPLEIIRSAALTPGNRKALALFLPGWLDRSAGDAPVLTTDDVPLASPAVLLDSPSSRKRPTRLLVSAARAAIDNFGPTQWTGEAFLKLRKFCL